MSAATLTRQERKRRKAARARERECEKRNLTPDEKRARRQEHARLITCALAELGTVEGMEAFLRSRQLNQHLTPLAAALVAYQLPGRIAAPVRWWGKAGHKVRKGEVARGYVTAPGFWPLAVFTAEQTDYPDEYIEAAEADVAEASAGMLEALVALLLERFEADGTKTPALNGWVEETGV